MTATGARLVVGQDRIKTDPRSTPKVSYRVPFVNARKHYARYQSQFQAAISGCLENGDLILRQQLTDFERELARVCGVKHAVGVSSGYHALALSMIAAGLKPGDEVIAPAHTFVATISAIVHSGAEPVLCDVSPDYNVDLKSARRAITRRTRAILPVHLNGRMADMRGVEELAREFDLIVIEDAAQGLGASVDGRKAGSWGLTGCFSFYPFKILGCFGDGGAVTTNSDETAQAIRRLRFNGEDRATGEYHYHGYTALLDNIQAAVLSFKLTQFDSWVDHRRRTAELYRRGLTGIGDLRLPHFDDSAFYDVFQNYVIRTSRREDLRAHLKEQGVETLVHWARPMWHHPGLKLGSWNFPETESICREVISLPMSAETEEAEVGIVVDVIRSFFQR